MTVQDPTGISGWQRIDAQTTTSGWLAQGDIETLARLGVRHVINLAVGGQPGFLENEAELLAAHGIAYTHVPVPFNAPDEQHYTAFCQAFDQGPRPVHVHCIMNLRVSAFLFRYHREHGGMDEAQARALMQRQWDPKTSEHPDAPAWARFILGPAG